MMFSVKKGATYKLSTFAGRGLLMAKSALGTMGILGMRAVTK